MKISCNLKPPPRSGRMACFLLVVSAGGIMAEAAETFWLIVDPVPRADERVQEMAADLGRQGLDPYTVRQRLVGSAPALLAQGGRPALEKAAGLLAARGFAPRFILPRPPRFSPPRIYGLQLQADRIVFDCRPERVVLDRGTGVLAVLADLSGAVVDKTLKRLVVQNAYRGRDALAPLSEEEVRRTILQGEPVLDLYTLSEGGEISSGVRIFAGKFDPRGLGRKGTFSASRNLEILLEEVRARAGTFVLDQNFGLAALPGCRPRRPEPGGDPRRENLASLTRYGWITAALLAERDGAQDAPRQGAGPGAAFLPEIFPEEAADAEAGGGACAETAPPGLPPPPEIGEERGVRQRVKTLAGGAGSLFLLGFFGGERALEVIFVHGIRTGILPLALSLACFFGGWRYLGHRHQMENLPTSRARSLAMGMVELHGRAVRRYAVVSPMSHLACVWWRLSRYRRDRHDRWRLVGTRSSGPVPFYLEDGTGRVLVEPRGATVRSRNRQEGAPGGGSLLFAGEKNTDEKWVEETLPEGAPVYVLGFARPRKGVRLPLRERTAEALRRLKGDRDALRQYDADGDGRISPEEWDAARAAVERQVLNESLQPAGASAPGDSAPVIGRPAARSLPFLIAEAETESRLSKTFGAISLALFLLGLVAAALSAWLILLRFP